MTCNEKVMKQLTAISVSSSPAVCTLHIHKIPCALRNAYPSVLLGGIVFHLQVWLSVVKQQHLLFWIFFLPWPERVASWMSSINFIIWLNKLPALCYSVLFFFHKLYIWLFASRELKARKHFQIELHGCNQNSGDSWRVWTCPVREQWDPRWCPHGQTHDSLKVHVICVPVTMQK